MGFSRGNRPLAPAGMTGRRFAAAALLSAAVLHASAQPMVWPTVWATPEGLPSVAHEEFATDGDPGTAMRASGPLHAGAFLQLDTRSAIKVTHVVLVEHISEYLRAGRVVANRRGVWTEVAKFGGESERTRTPEGHTVITLVPPLKLSHAPFVIRREYPSYTVASAGSYFDCRTPWQLKSPPPNKLDGNCMNCSCIVRRSRLWTRVRAWPSLRGRHHLLLHQA